MLKYIGFRAARLIVGRLPVSLGYVIAYVAATIVFCLAVRTRRVVAENQRLAGGPGAPGLRRRTHRVFVNQARNYFDLIHLPSLNLGKLQSRISVEGWHYVEQCIMEGRGIVFATAHLGSPDLVAQAFPRDAIRLLALTEPLKPDYLYQLVMGWRRRIGIEFVPATQQHLVRVARVVRAGGAVAVAADRDIQGNGIVTDFLGGRARLPGGAVQLADRMGAVLIPGFCVRRGWRDFVVHFEPPLELDSESPPAARTVHNVQRLANVLERYIRCYPDQWTVMSPVCGPA